MSRTWRTIALFCGALLAVAGYERGQGAAADGVPWPPAYTQPAAAAGVQSASTSPDHRAVFERYCVNCHNEKVKSGGLLLDRMDIGNAAADGEQWEKVVRKLRSRAMPPAGRPRPDEQTYDAVATHLENELDRRAAASANPGRVAPFRRLTRTEYGNAIRDLLALTELPKAIDLAVLLPADNSSTGFDNLADLLFVSSTQLEQYVSAAQKIARLAVGDPDAPPIVDTYRMSSDHSQDSPVESLPPGTRGGTLIRTYLPLDGQYHFHIELAGAPPTDAVYLELSVDSERARLFTVSDKAAPAVEDAFPAKSATATPVELDPGVEIPIESVVNRRFERDKAARARRAALARGFSAVLSLKAGPRAVGVTFVKRPSGPVESLVLTSRTDTGQGPDVASITIKGPTDATGSGDTPSRRRIFVCDPTTVAQERPCARQILATVARRAYRRPVTAADIEPLMTMYHAGRAEGGFIGGIEQGIERILVSPQFLFRVERDPANTPPNTLYRISDTELASRLSFFLWSSIPDDELLDVAIKGALKDPDTLSRQVKRMLADSRASALAGNFGAQWLYLRDIDTKSPSPRAFPGFDLRLIADFHRETELFLTNVFGENRSVLELLTANYTFLNERLAAHYGIPGVYGPEFRRVVYPNGSPRLGLLGHGSILTLTSYANRTSPVLRGKYVLTNILGAPPPPPPADVPALVTENKESGRALSMREAMAQHRRNPACASCHARMDPIGFALDNFDAVGRYRTVSEAGDPIDSSGTFPDGSTFAGVAGLREVLLGRPEEFVLTMSDRLLTYALGRSLEHYDAPVLRSIVRDARAQKYGFASLVAGIVSSMPFQTRRTAATPSGSNQAGAPRSEAASGR